MDQRVESSVGSAPQNAWQSLRPILLWLNIIGIDLPVDKTVPKIRRWAGIVYSLFWLITNISSHICRNTLGFSSNLTLHKYAAPQVLSWNIKITVFGYTIHRISTHLVFVLIIQQQWPRLRNCFQQLGGEQKIYAVYCKTTKMSLICIATEVILWLYTYKK